MYWHGAVFITWTNADEIQQYIPYAGIGFVLNMRQSITWTNADKIHIIYLSDYIPLQAII